MAATARGGDTLVERHQFSGTRDAVRLLAVAAAIDILVRRMASLSPQ